MSDQPVNLGTLGDNVALFSANLWKSVSIYIRAIPARVSNSADADQLIPVISPIRHLAWAVFFYFAGIVVSWLAFGHGAWSMVVLGWIMTTHGSRKLQLNLGHACAHGTVTLNPATDNFIGQVVHAIVLATAFHNYQPMHTLIHHSWHKLATEDDPTYQSLAKAGILAGVPKRTLYWRLLRACFSPLFHFQIFAERLESHLQDEGDYRVLFLVCTLSLIVLLTVTQAWISFAIAVLIPLVWGYQTSQLLRLCVEHRLPADPQHPRPVSEMHELTDEYVLRLSSPVDMAIRVLCLTCDSVRHAYHHYNPKSRYWSNYISAGPRATREAMAKGITHQYHEIIGFRAALDGCFDALSHSLPEGQAISTTRKTAKWTL